MEKEKKKKKKLIQIHSIKSNGGPMELDISVEGQRMPYVLDIRDSYGLSKILNPLVQELILGGHVKIQPLESEGE